MDIQDCRLNEVVIKMSHSSYEMCESLSEQLSAKHDGYSCGCRGLVLDANFTTCDMPAAATFFEVYRKERPERPKYLAYYLSELRAWHDANPKHGVVLVFINLKDNAIPSAIVNGITSAETYPSQLDVYLETFFGKDFIYKPSDLVGDNSDMSLLNRVLEHGWPTLEEIGDRFIFCVTGEWCVEYINSSIGERYCFAEQLIEKGTSMLPDVDTSSNFVFYSLKVDVGSERSRLAAILGHFQSLHLITRVSSIDNEAQWHDALQYGANVITTSKVSGASWAQLPDDLFYSQQRYVQWSSVNGVLFDDGMRPSVAISPRGTLVEVHEGGLDGELYLREGCLDASKGLNWLSEAKRYDSGTSPRIIISEKGVVATFHYSRRDSRLFYSVGRWNGDGSVLMIRERMKFLNGENPSVTITTNREVVIVYNRVGSQDLCYSSGRLTGTMELEWYWVNKKYGTGTHPAIMTTPSGDIVAVHSRTDDGQLYYSVGRIDDDGSIEWNTLEMCYDRGRRPNVAATSNGVIVEVHNGVESSNLYHSVGRLAEDGTIEWSYSSMKYGTGMNPVVVALDEATIVELHNDVGSNKLYYNIATLHGF